MNKELSKIASIVGGIILAGTIGFIGAKLSVAIEKPVENSHRIDMLEKDRDLLKIQVGELTTQIKILDRLITRIEVLVEEKIK